MKELQITKMVEQTEIKFIADDGREFTGRDAESRCKAYERQQNESRVKAEFAKLDAVEYDLPVLKWCNSDYSVWKILLESKKDFYAMEDYFKVVRGCYDNYIDMPTEFPAMLTVVEQYECIGEYKTLEEDLIASLFALNM